VISATIAIPRLYSSVIKLEENNHPEFGMRDGKYGGDGTCRFVDRIHQGGEEKYWYEIAEKT